MQRTQSRPRRGSARALGLAALVAVLAACSASAGVGSASAGGTGSASPGASTATPTPSSRPTVALTAMAVTMRTAAEPILRTQGWTVVSTTQADPAGSRTTEIDLVIRKVPGSARSSWVTDGTESHVVLLRDPAAGDTALRLSSGCTPTSCKIRVDHPSCFVGIDCPRSGQSIPLTADGGRTVGSLITWSSSGQTGRAVEATIGIDPARTDVPTAALADPVGYELVNAIWHLKDG